MAKSILSQSDRGEYQRDLGWERRPDGTLKPHRFRVGQDKTEAQIRILRLEQVWRVVQDRHHRDGREGAACWDETTLAIANAIRKGESEVVISTPLKHSVQKQLTTYSAPVDPAVMAARFNQLAADFFMIRLQPSADQIIAAGIDQLNAQSDHHLERAHHFARLAKPKSGQTLHAALDEYIKWLPSKFISKESDGSTSTSDWGLNQIRQAKLLKEHHTDRSLDDLSLTAVEQWMDYWAARPNRKNTNRPIAIDTAANAITQIKLFLKWLHKSEKFSWRKPADLDELRPRILITEEEKAKKGSPIQVKTYTLDQLTLLYKFATPRERLWMLLGLNCAFNQEEISSLTRQHVMLETIHPYAHLMEDFEPSPKDSFIGRTRNKTGVYGDWKLWKVVVDGLKRQLPSEGRVFTTKDGRKLTGHTKGKNRGKAIANAWYSLNKRIQKQHPDFPRLSFGKLRKTSGNFIRSWKGYEEAYHLHMCHGIPLRTDELADIYSNKPFPKVYDALRRLHDHLQPMFDAVGDPWTDEGRKDLRGNPGLPQVTKDQIKALRQQGVTIKEICQRFGISKMTVCRYSKIKAK